MIQNMLRTINFEVSFSVFYGGVNLIRETQARRTLFAMVISMLLGYMPWYNFSAVSKYIIEEFNLTSQDTGLILSCFQAGYVVIVVFSGWLGDKIGLKRIVFWATLSTGIFSTLFVWGACSKISIMIFRLLTGLSAGAIYVPGIALLSRWFPPQRRGGVLGLYTAALVAAYAGGYFVAAPIAGIYGWRTGILWTSLPAFIGALIVSLFVSEAPTPEESAFTIQIKSQMVSCNNNTTVSAKLPRSIMGPLLISLGYMGHMWEQYAFWGWIGPFMTAVAVSSGMKPDRAATWAGIVAACIILLGAPASWIWGVVSDRIGRIRAIALAACFSLVAEFGLGYIYTYKIGFVIVVAAWIGFWVVADSALYKAGLTEMVSPKTCGLCLGFQSAVGYFTTIIAPLAFGAILQAYNGLVSPVYATFWGPSFAILGLGGLLVPISLFLLKRQAQAKLMAGGRNN